MLYITTEGGLVTSITSDDKNLVELINKEGVIVIDYGDVTADDEQVERVYYECGKSTLAYVDRSYEVVETAIVKVGE